MSKESIENKKKRVLDIIHILVEEYPDAKCTLDWETPYQLLVASILAAQCTDERVNQVTPNLFRKYKSVHDFASADMHELEEDIKSTGFFRNKAKAIIASANEILSEYSGIIPDNIEQLVKLTGVGRKTANLIVGVAYGKPAIIVDTHMKRVSERLGLTEKKEPDKIESDLWEIVPLEDATKFNHLIVAHGRAVCKASKPLCNICRIIDYCPYGNNELKLGL